MNKFIPKNYKYNKIRKRVRISKTKNFRSYKLKFGLFGLKILENGVISSVVLEAARRSISRKLKRSGRLIINGFPHIPITSKSLGVRMGKGSGNISGWCFPVKKGKILFEIDNVSPELAKSALKSASFKLPVKSKFVYNKYYDISRI